MHRNDRPLRSVLLRVVLVLASSVRAFSLAELLVRILDVGPQFHVVSEKNYRLSENPILKYELVPGSPDRDSFISTAGLRDREFVRKRPSDVFRIAVSGDSVTYGFDVEQQETFSKQLERMLNTCVGAGGAKRRFEVLNLGIAGFNITQSVERLRVLGLRFQPNLVIFVYVLNAPQSFSAELAYLLSMKEQAQAGRERAWAKFFSVGFTTRGHSWWPSGS